MPLFSKFEVLEEPRDTRGKKYKLIDILIMTIYGILCGLTDFTNIADFMKLKEDYFIELLNLKMGLRLMIAFLIFLNELILKSLWKFLLNGLKKL